MVNPKPKLDEPTEFYPVPFGSFWSHLQVHIIRENPVSVTDSVTNHHMANLGTVKSHVLRNRQGSRSGFPGNPSASFWNYEHFMWQEQVTFSTSIFCGVRHGWLFETFAQANLSTSHACFISLKILSTMSGPQDSQVG